VAVLRVARGKHDRPAPIRFSAAVRCRDDVGFEVDAVVGLYFPAPVVGESRYLERIRYCFAALYRSLGIALAAQGHTMIYYSYGTAILTAREAKQNQVRARAHKMLEGLRGGRKLAPLDLPTGSLSTEMVTATTPITRD
jgi:hypothetical protein